ncbi:MAG TPA: 50S ribosomal protein L11 methyltransferase [Firmicutes bacterium]|nr:50S ribosomal protein L11 methyltransferase [Bacillota bacterium]
MDWTEIIVEIPTAQTETASAIAQMVVPYGIYIEDYANLETEVREIARIDLIDEELLQKDRSHSKIHIYIKPAENPMEAVSFLRERLEAEKIPYSIHTLQVKEEDWETTWQKYYHPMRVGRHMMICPSWETCTLAEGDLQITLNPGMAFGTGTHETTRLCMTLLEQHTAPDKTILDIGCGSGILAITGVLLGAKRAVGVDIDQLAVKVAEENAALNRVSDRTQFLLGDLTDQVSGQYDIICANIVADVIIRLLENIQTFMAPGAVLLCSGIIVEREPDVVSALQAHGFTVTNILHEGGWSAIECRLA